MPGDILELDVDDDTLTVVVLGSNDHVVAVHSPERGTAGAIRRSELDGARRFRPPEGDVLPELDPSRAEALARKAFEAADHLDVWGLREHLDQPAAGEAVAGVGEEPGVTSE